MAEEKKWEKWEGSGEPKGNGGKSGSGPTQPGEVEGRSRQLLVTCPKCGAQSYVGVDWKWFTCSKCGGTLSEIVP